MLADWQPPCKGDWLTDLLSYETNILNIMSQFKYANKTNYILVILLHRKFGLINNKFSGDSDGLMVTLSEAA